MLMTRTRSFVRRVVGPFAALAAVSAVLAAAPPVGGEINVDKDGLALKGYDPVAYFAEAGKATKGDAAITAQHAGATYRFATAENKAAFEKEPAKYVPQYGGYCAYGVSKGAKYDIEPTAFQVVDGKLYVNYDASVQKKFTKDPGTFIAKADKNWDSVKSKPKS